MIDNPNFFKDISWKSLTIGDAVNSLVTTAKEQRDMAQNRQSQKLSGEEGLEENAQYSLLEWNTHIKVGEKVKKVKIWLANERTKVVGYHEYKFDYWPLFDRVIYPTAHDFDGVSVPDVLEDKQRARAVLSNLGLNIVRSQLYPRYIYDSNRITNKKHLDFGFNKHIPVDGPADDGVIRPVRNYMTDKQLLDFLYNSIDLSAQKAVARPEMQQGVLSQERRTLGELNLVSANVNTRDSLTSKVWGWSDRRKWRHHYQMYKIYFADDIDQKILRLEGAFGPKYRKTRRKDIITRRLDPDVFVESFNVSRAKQLEERQLFSVFFSQAFTDPSANRRWGLKKLAKLNGLAKDEIDRLLPPTIDERDAEDENEMLNEGKFVRVFPEDDDNVHLDIHAKAETTPATTTHIETHKRKLLMRKTNPELFPEQQVNTFQPGTGPQGQQPGLTQMKPLVPSQTSGQGQVAQNLPPMQ